MAGKPIAKTLAAKRATIRSGDQPRESVMAELDSASVEGEEAAVEVEHEGDMAMALAW